MVQPPSGCVAERENFPRSDDRTAKPFHCSLAINVDRANDRYNDGGAVGVRMRVGRVSAVTDSSGHTHRQATESGSLTRESSIPDEDERGVRRLANVEVGIARPGEEMAGIGRGDRARQRGV